MPSDRHSESETPELEALTRAAGAGDGAAVAELLERYQGELHAFVRLRYGRLLQGRESSMDVVQSVCREVLEHADRFKHPGQAAFKRWLFVTALRKIKNRHGYYLAEKRDVLREALAPDDEAAEALMQQYRTFSTPSRVAIAREEVVRVEEAFEGLSDEQREVVTLAHMGGLSRQEIGEQMGKSEGAVRVLLHRALAKLSAHLGDERSQS